MPRRARQFEIAAAHAFVKRIVFALEPIDVPAPAFHAHSRRFQGTSSSSVEVGLEPAGRRLAHRCSDARSSPRP